MDIEAVVPVILAIYPLIVHSGLSENRVPKNTITYLLGDTYHFQTHEHIIESWLRSVVCIYPDENRIKYDKIRESPSFACHFVVPYGDFSGFTLPEIPHDVRPIPQSSPP